MWRFCKSLIIPNQSILQRPLQNVVSRSPLQNVISNSPLQNAVSRSMSFYDSSKFFEVLSFKISVVHIEFNWV